MPRVKPIWLIILIAMTSMSPARAATPVTPVPSSDYWSTDPDILLPYESPGMFDWIAATPGNLLSFGKKINPKKNYRWIAGITASSLLLIKYDQDIVDASQKIARRMGLISDTKTGRETFTLIDAKLGSYDLPLVVPRNVNSVMYFFGDGLAHLGVVGGLLGYGLYYNDKRAISTASQTAEALVMTGIIVQVIKRTTGREAPFVATEKGGKWQWFPNQLEYNRKVPQFDAFPSGHLATVMATTTVLADNYPQHRYIWPLSTGIMTLLSFAMLNNGVHWAGDYPLGLAIGYVAGKVALERNRKQRKSLLNNRSQYKPGYWLMPYVNNGVTGLQLKVWF